MKFIFKSLFWLLVLVLLVMPAMLWFALSDHPAVSQQDSLSHDDIARAKAILSANLPRGAVSGSEHVFRVREQDIDLVAGYLIRKIPGAAVKVDVGASALSIQATAGVPLLPFKNFVNASFKLPVSTGMPQVEDLRVGQWPVPDAVAGWLLTSAVDQFGRGEQYRLAESSVKDVRVAPGMVEVYYIWQEDLIDKAREGYFTEDQRMALSAYHTKLLRMGGEVGLRGSLVAAFQPLFTLAANRSRKTSAVVENRALLLVLGAWASGRGMSALVGELGPGERLGAFRLALDGRHDFGQHFLTSAGLVAGGDRHLSDAVGLFKEIDDSDGGSGFSFTDLAADRAGTRFGELLLDRDRAADIQQRLAAGVAEADIMPPAKDLPEGMSMVDFSRRFGSVDDPRYRKVSEEIERRLDNTPLFRNK